MIIGINANLIKDSGEIFNRLADNYCEAVCRAGGTPVVLPCIDDIKKIPFLLKRVDGLILSGGADLHPSCYGEKLLPQTKPLLIKKQRFDLALAQYAWRKRMPTLAICYGIQLLNVSRGGTLFQNIERRLKTPSHKKSFHRVYINEGNLLYKIIKNNIILVNSFHHQAIKKEGRGLIVSAKSEDGLIEGVESNDPKRFFIGVQWHPERMKDNKESCRLFHALISRARNPTSYLFP